MPVQHVPHGAWLSFGVLALAALVALVIAAYYFNKYAGRDPGLFIL
jgi:hypothetical protein